MIRTPLGGFVNHAEDSNCELIEIGPNIYLYTKKDIMPEEELTLTYSTYSVKTVASF
jgi:SET domain-containing protein